MLEEATNQQLLEAWRNGSEAAASILVRRYMLRLTALVRSRLSRKLARRVDPEDVVLSAWRSFFVAAGDGRVAPASDDDLWPLLVTFTLRKLARQGDRQNTLRRDVSREIAYDAAADWPEIASRDPSPDESAAVADEVEALLEQLKPGERAIVSRRLQGFDQESIAGELGCSVRTVKRVLHKIREFYAPRGAIAPFTTPTSPTPCAMHSERSRIPARDLPGSVPVSYADYVLHQWIGQGGFGRVYRATRRSDGACVAIKALKKSFWKNSRAVAALRRESAILSSLAHPGLVRHHGWGVSPHGALFLVMDWVEGGNLQEWSASGSPSLTEIRDCGIQLARAIAAVHAAGIIHGDVTPTNVLRDATGTIRLTDFGFATMIGDAGFSTGGGTPGFLAPEQLSDAFGPVSPLTDVYALGGCLYSLVSGRPPIVGRDVPEILARVLSGETAPAVEVFAPHVPASFSQLIAECLRKEPADRPRSAAEVAERLAALRLPGS